MCPIAVEWLEFPPIETANSEDEQMAAPKPKADWTNWIAPIIAVLIAVGSATWMIAHEFSALDQHIARVETAVRIIGAKQGGDTKEPLRRPLIL